MALDTDSVLAWETERAATAADPLVSVIIPVGPAHRQVVGHAVASALGGTVRDVEVIVVNDSGAPLGRYADPRVTVVEAPKRPGLRPAIARNAGLAVARGAFVVNLDADDYLLRDGLAVLLRAHAAHDRSYTYGLHYGTRPDGPVLLAGRPAINSYGVPYDAWDYTAANLHAISALVPRAAMLEVGGFDEGMPGWDDWGLFARLRRAGHCGHEVKAPVFVYRVHLSQQHHVDNAGGAALMQQARARIIGEGWEPMGCGCGGGSAAARRAAQQAVLGGGVPALTLGGAMASNNGGTRVLEYIGPGQGAQTFRGAVSRTAYRAGRNPAVRYLSTGNGLHEADIDGLIDLGLFREVPAPPAFAPAPAPVEPIEAEATVVTGLPQVAEEALGEVDGDGVARPTRARRERAQGKEAA